MLVRSVCLAFAVGVAGCKASEPETPADGERTPKDWLCRPPEGIDPAHAQEVVVIRVLVAKDGRAKDVRVEKDPGHGLADAMRECAKRARYYARDDKGNAIEAWSPPIKVRFTPP